MYPCIRIYGLKAASAHPIASRASLPALLDHMAVLADAIRCRLLLLLERHELTVGELCTILQLPQSTVSRHLKTLGDDGWVVSRRDGTSRYYGMTPSLAAPASRLWPLLREQATETSAAEQDARRVEAVMAERRSTSAQFFSSAAGQWDHLRNELFGQQFQQDALLALLDARLRIGDLGCGTGQFAALVAPSVAKVVAVDASAEMLSAARTRLTPFANVDVRRGSLEALPIEDAQLDVAVLAVVAQEDAYGYDVVRRLREAGLTDVGDASVYGTLRRLFAAGDTAGLATELERHIMRLRRGAAGTLDS